MANSRTKNKKNIPYDVYHLALTTDDKMRWKVMAAANKKTLSEMLQILINDYWERNAKRDIFPGTASKVKKVVIETLRKAAG